MMRSQNYKGHPRCREHNSGSCGRMGLKLRRGTIHEHHSARAKFQPDSSKTNFCSSTPKTYSVIYCGFNPGGLQIK